MDVGEINSIRRDIARYYSAKLDAHGGTALGVDWKDAASQQRRHVQFLHLIGEELGASIGDIGCGYGDFLVFLRSRGVSGRYVGCDVAEPMIEAARKLHGASPTHSFVIGEAVGETVDYVVASGIFNVKGGYPDETWEAYVDAVVDQMASSARRGFGFNILSSHSDPQRRRPDLYYADPVRFFHRCASRYGRKLALLQDYGLYEFTLLVRTD